MMPDYCEAITAYRCWNVHPNGLLVGQAHAEPWPPYEPFVGRCGALSGAGWAAHLQDGVFMPAPVMDCDCGVHALKTAASAEARAIEPRDGWYSFSLPIPRVWGAVKLWGRLIEHEIGYRAELAYPSALYCEDQRLAPIVAALYGVPCEVKKLARPERDSAARDGYNYMLNQIYFLAPNVVYQPRRLGVVTSISGPTAPAPSTPLPSLIAPASLTQINAVSATRYQQQRAKAAAAHLAAQSRSWQDIMKNGLYVQKDDNLTPP